MQVTRTVGRIAGDGRKRLRLDAGLGAGRGLLEAARQAQAARCRAARLLRGFTAAARPAPPTPATLPWPGAPFAGSRPPAERRASSCGRGRRARPRRFVVRRRRRGRLGRREPASASRGLISSLTPPSFATAPKLRRSAGRVNGAAIECGSHGDPEAPGRRRAVSGFRLEKLNAALAAAGLDWRVGASRHMHFVDVADATTDVERGVVERLLRYGPEPPPAELCVPPTAARGAEARHGLALVVEGHRHRAPVRPRLRAADRARDRVPPPRHRRTRKPRCRSSTTG